MELQADFIVVGGGIAGLRALASLIGRGDILLLTKAGPAESNTGYAQGGIAAAIGPDDSPELHLADTLAAGAGLCDRAAVDLLVHEGPRYVRELVDWGVPFDRGRMASRPSRAKARTASGACCTRATSPAARSPARCGAGAAAAPASACCTTRWRRRSTSRTASAGACASCVTTAATGMARARAVLLATGGAGRVFRETTNPAVATGDGLAMAYRCGAQVSDLEFVQFHPTVLSAPGAARFLLSEALRGEGARLVNADGEAFMSRYDPAGDLAPRDVVATRNRARADADRTRGVPVARAPRRRRACAPGFRRSRRCVRPRGSTSRRDPLPVSPAAHYMCGGVDTDLDGRTSIPGLFAAGEVACTGVHGANRLASNSLLEGLVFGARAADAMQSPAAARAAASRRSLAPRRGCREGWRCAGERQRRRGGRMCRSVMWEGAGLVRDADGLRPHGGPRWRGEPAARGRAGRRVDRAPGGKQARLRSWRGWSRARRSAARRAAAATGVRTFPARDDLHWQVHVADRRAVEGYR